jgi:TonB family protein
MKCTGTTLSIALLLSSGCVGSRQVADPAQQVELTRMTPLPPVTWTCSAFGEKMGFLVHILEDGAVGNVKMLGTSGDSEWDSLAVEIMKQWQYAPVRRDGVRADIWFRQPVVLQFKDPIVMIIGELELSSLHEADSLYALLQNGVDLDTLFRSREKAVDINTYPQRVRDELRRLGQNQYTQPVRLGEMYVIYKRFPGDTL